jgi:hypothetical protein
MVNNPFCLNKTTKILSCSNEFGMYVF